jgi:hypothetical protein
MATTITVPQSDALWTTYEEHLAACAACPTAPAVQRNGTRVSGNCPEALRLLDAFNAQSVREVEEAVNRYYPRSRYSEEERAAARSHFTWHGDDCGC